MIRGATLGSAGNLIGPLEMILIGVFEMVIMETYSSPSTWKVLSGKLFTDGFFSNIIS